MQAQLRNAPVAIGAAAMQDDPFTDETLVTQTKLKAIAGGISDMTVWRWRRAGVIPEPVSIRGRNYWRTRDILAALRHLTAPQAA